MIISHKYKYIYIDIPKTGCTAIQNYLLENDKSCKQGWINTGKEKIKIDSHTKTREVKKALGEKFKDYTVFTFIREPFSRGVSTYFFYKTVSRTRSFYLVRNILGQLNTLLAKVIPFSIWSILKPQKKTVDYFFDEEGNLLIDLVGKTENMNSDLSRICNEAGIPIYNVEVPVKNSSKHSSAENYFSNEVHKKVYKYLLKDDIRLYKKYADKIRTAKFNKSLVYD